MVYQNRCLESPASTTLKPWNFIHSMNAYPSAVAKFSRSHLISKFISCSTAVKNLTSATYATKNFLKKETWTNTWWACIFKKTSRWRQWRRRRKQVNEDKKIGQGLELKSNFISSHYIFNAKFITICKIRDYNSIISFWLIMQPF
jgi:hypothetical protein